MDDVIPQSETLTLRVPSDYTPKDDHEASNEEGEKSNGILTSFVSNLVSPRSANKSGEFAKRKVEEEAEAEAGEIVNGEAEKNAGEGENGGVISNMISSFFSPSEDRKGEDEVKGIGNHKRLKMDEEEEKGKGGLIDNIVSHLPTLISDDAAPTTDEASILIHTCVKD